MKVVQELGATARPTERRPPPRYSVRTEPVPPPPRGTPPAPSSRSAGSDMRERGARSPGAAADSGRSKGLMADRIGHAEGLAAIRTRRWQVVGGGVGVLRLAQWCGGGPLLAARLASERLTQAPRPRWLLQPITRRRLAAVGAVQPELPLQLRHTRQQHGDRIAERRVLRPKLRDHIFRTCRGGRCLFAGGISGVSSARVMDRLTAPDHAAEHVTFFLAPQRSSTHDSCCRFPVKLFLFNPYLGSY